jgi:hypothetical protein
MATTPRRLRPQGMTLQEAFDWYPKTEVEPPPHLSTKCLAWQASVRSESNPYGNFWWGSRTVYAHRVAYELAYGEIPDGMVVDHRCWNPRCVNPDHLRLATRKQNNENLSQVPKNSTSGIRGVTWHKGGRKWRAHVKHNGKEVHLGFFDSIEDADAVARAKRAELFTHVTEFPQAPWETP